MAILDEQDALARLRRFEDAALDLAELQHGVALGVEQPQEIVVVEPPAGDLRHEREIARRRPGRNRRRLPTLAASLRNVIVQVFSRSALENSQVPAIALAESPGAGGCANAAPEQAASSSKS